MPDAAPVTGSVPTTTGTTPLPKNDNRVIWLLLGAAFVAILNETTMGVAIPHLITDLNITAVAAQWLTACSKGSCSNSVISYVSFPMSCAPSQPPA